MKVGRSIMENIILKYGGVTTANSENIKKIAENIASHTTPNSNIFVVVSAPGSVDSAQKKVTDILIDLHADLTQKNDISQNWKLFSQRFMEIAKTFQIEKFTNAILNKIKQSILEKNNYDFTLSRGEFLTAKMLAKITKSQFIDAKNVLFFSEEELDFEKSKKALDLLVAKSKHHLFVVPGFYATANEAIKIFTRDGSDYSGSLLALVCNASIYKNIKDVNGLMSANPRIIEKPKQVYKISYKNLNLLTSNGAKILHSSTIKPLMKTSTKLYICNLFQDKKPTIAIKENIKTKNGFVSLTGKTNLILATIEKKQNYLSQLAQAFDIFGEMNLTLVNLIYENEEILLLFEKQNFKIISLLDVYDNNFYIKEHISQITLVGINFDKNVIKKITNALEKNFIYPIHITTTDNLSCIKILVEEKYYEKACLSIYNAFYKKFWFFDFKLK